MGIQHMVDELGFLSEKNTVIFFWWTLLNASYEILQGSNEDEENFDENKTQTPNEMYGQRKDPAAPPAVSRTPHLIQISKHFLI